MAGGIAAVFINSRRANGLTAFIAQIRESRRLPPNDIARLAVRRPGSSKRNAPPWRTNHYEEKQ